MPTTTHILPLADAFWQDTGVIALPGNALTITATGEGLFSGIPSDRAFPSGAYLTNPSPPGAPEEAHADFSTFTWAARPAENPPVPGVSIVPWSLVVALRDDAGPGANSPVIGTNEGVYRPNYGPFTITNTSGVAKRVFLIFNDSSGEYINNSGAFTVTLDTDLAPPPDPLAPPTLAAIPTYVPSGDSETPAIRLTGGPT